MNKESGINNSFAGPGNVAIRSIDTSVAGLANPATISSHTSVATVAVPGDTAIRSSDAKNDSSSVGNCCCTPAKTPKSAKRLNRNPLKQAFRKAWLKDPQFQLWLQETEDPHKAKCTHCWKFLKAGKSHLQQHANTATHIMNIKRKAGASISVLPSNAASIDTSFARPGNAVISSSDAENHSSTDVSIAGPSSAAAAITRPDTENDSSSDSTFIVPAAMEAKTAKTLNSKPRKQAFRRAWLEDPHFKPWLEETEDPHKAKCTLCCKFIIAGKSHLQQHAITEIHIMKIKEKAGASTSVPSNAATTSIDTSFAEPGNAAISSTDAENDSSRDSTFIAPAAMESKTAKTLNSKPRKQAFRRAWLEDPHFKPWLEETEDPHKAKCTLCCKFIIAGKSHLQQHATTEIHITKIKEKAEASISVPSNAATTSIDTSFAGPGNAAISSSDAENDSSSGSTFIVPAAKIMSRQTFRQAWLEDPHFKPWLQQADDPHKAKCTVCSKYVKAGKSDLQNHANSEAHNMNMVHQKEARRSTIKWTFADIVNVAEMTICIDAVEHDKRQCQVDEVPSTSSASEAASTRTRRNGETPTTPRRIHPIVHDHRYAKIPRSMWKKILVQKKQIQAMKREKHVDKQQIFRLKKQVTSLKRIVNELRRARALPDSGPRDFFQKRLLIRNQKNIRQTNY